MDLFNILEHTVMTVEVINEHVNVVMEFELFLLFKLTRLSTRSQ